MPAAASKPATPPAPPLARRGPSVDAQWAGNPVPAYPAMARRLGEEGEVRLDVWVGADGRVRDVRLTRSSGSALLDDAAIEALRAWQFRPATVDGVPVAEWYRDWRWVFRLEE